MLSKRTVENSNDEIKTQMKLYATLTKGDSVFTLDQGFWLISPCRDGGYAWARTKSDGEF